MRKGSTILFLIVILVVAATAQDKPRVFVRGKGSENVTSGGSGGGGKHWAAWGSRSTVDSHDESMEVTKDLQKNCSGVILTINDSNADYVVMLNRESKQNRGLLRSNSQVQVANRVGDILGTSATHTVGNAAKDACNLIVADWQEHGRLNSPEASQTIPNQPEVHPAVSTTPGPAVSPAVEVKAQQPVTAASDEASAKEKQRKACLELAKDNPSITCK